MRQTRSRSADPAAARVGLITCVALSLLGAACGGSAPVRVPSPDGGGSDGDVSAELDGGGPGTADLATPRADMSRLPDLAPAIDPCIWADLGDGTYCGANLKGPGAATGDPATLYLCKAKRTAIATPCANGCYLAPRGVHVMALGLDDSVPRILREAGLDI